MGRNEEIRSLVWLGIGYEEIDLAWLHRKASLLKEIEEVAASQGDASGGRVGHRRRSP
jgi:hypothetical protein